VTERLDRWLSRAGYALVLAGIGYFLLRPAFG
jgi:hypothetical protein